MKKILILLSIFYYSLYAEYNIIKIDDKKEKKNLLITIEDEESGDEVEYRIDKKQFEQLLKKHNIKNYGGCV